MKHVTIIAIVLVGFVLCSCTGQGSKESPIIQPSEVDPLPIGVEIAREPRPLAPDPAVIVEPVEPTVPDVPAPKVIGRPDRITPEAAEIFGYDPKEWEAHGVPLRRALTELAALLPKGKTTVPAGQNVRMDVQFLERGYRSCEIPYPFDYHVVDLATLYYSWSLVAGETVPALSLRQAAIHAGLAEGPVAHRALADARLTLETYRHYIGRLAPRPLPDTATGPGPDPNRKPAD